MSYVISFAFAMLIGIPALALMLFGVDAGDFVALFVGTVTLLSAAALINSIISEAA
jgi:hypothetical protein